MKKLFILNLNDKCNNRCLFCFEGKRIEAAPSISKEQAEELIIKAKKSGFSLIDIFGGEPTVHSYLIDLIKLSDRLGFKITLASNARMFSYKKYAESFRGLPIIGIRTSLHSHKEADHDFITQSKGSFKQTVSGIKNILKLGIPLLVNVVISCKNYKNLLAITRFVKRLGLVSIKYSGLVLEGRCLENKKLIPRWKEFRPYLIKALDFARKNNLKIFIEKLPICFFPKNNYLFIPDLMPNFVKLKICRRCKDKNRCVGIDKLYIKLFPEDKKLVGNFTK